MRDRRDKNPKVEIQRLDEQKLHCWSGYFGPNRGGGILNLSVCRLEELVEVCRHVFGIFMQGTRQKTKSIT